MNSPSIAFGAVVAGSLWGLEHRRQQSAERLAAAAFESLLNAIEATDHETGQHLRRVARYSLILGDAAGLRDHDLRAVERIALFHDIGKIHEALFDVVHDDACLTPADRRAIATHPQRGADVLAPLASFYPELPTCVIAHHERWDGKGYPRRLRGRRIPLFARLVAITDTFDVIANGRHYRRAGGAELAAMEIARGRGQQFDPELVDLMLWPPVLESLADAHRSSYQRESKTGPDRRKPNSESLVPDVRFRWRSTMESPATARRKSESARRPRKRTSAG